MNAVDIALPRLQTEEGFRALPYKDTNGFTTVGYGFNVDAGLGRDEAAALLAAQLGSRHTALLAFGWYANLDEPRQSVCLDMSFNLGLHGLLSFPHMISALAAHDWETAANECKVQDPLLANRYAALAQILLTGTV
jgi:lysozyme